MKIAIIGDNNIILGFKALGVNTFSVKNKFETEQALDKIKSENDYGIIFITENFTEQVKEKLEEIKGEALPAIVPIPSNIKTGAGLKNLKSIVEKAVGSDILFK